MTDAGTVALENVSIRYGRLLAVDRLTLHVHVGEIFGLLGPNGSGKSSTLEAVAGLLTPADGSIRIDGVSRREQSAAYSRLIGYVPQEPALYDELSAWDNLNFFAALYDMPRRNRLAAIARSLELVDLTGRARDRVGGYSGGMRRRLNVAAALLHDPAVLLLDEPTVALDPASRDLLLRLLGELREQNRIIIFTTHHLEEAEQYCDRVGILQKGRLAAIGRPAEVLHPRTRASSVLGVLREEMTEQTEVAIRMRLAAQVGLHVDARNVRLTAPDGEQLALAMALLASEGCDLESFRTPPGQLEPLAQEWPDLAPMAATGGSACSAS